MKIKDLLKEKLYNFKNFIQSEFNRVDIDEVTKDAVLNEIDSYMNNLNLFVELLVFLAGFDPEVAIKLYLQKHKVDYEEIKEHIDNEKLLRYFIFFSTIVKEK